jgi:hypothetical protein
MAATRAHAVVARSLVLFSALSVFGFAKDKPKVTADEVLTRYVQAIGGEDAIRKAQTSAARYHVSESSGRSYEYTVYKKAPQKALWIYTGDRNYRSGYNGSVGWNQGPTGKVRRLKGDDLRRREEAARSFEALDLRSRYTITYEDLDRTGSNGVPRHVLKFKDHDGRVCYHYYDSTTFLEVEIRCGSGMDLVEGLQKVEDYRPVEGVLMSFRRVSTWGPSQANVIPLGEDTIATLKSVTVNEPLDDTMFDPPESRKKK